MPSWTSEPDNARAWRRLAAAVLLHALDEAGAGDAEAAAFVLGEDARQIADDLDLPAWPPPREAWRRVRYLSWATERGAVEPITRPRLMRGRRRDRVSGPPLAECDQSNSVGRHGGRP